MRRPLGYSFVQRGAEAGILLVSLALLARLVPPAAFGLFATAYAPVLLLEGFVRTGAAAAIIRTERLDDGRATSAALFAGGAAAGGALLLCALAAGLSLVPAAAAQPVAALLPVLAVRIVLVPAVAVAEATMMRALAFDALCLIGIAAALANAATAVWLASRGGEAEALAFGTLAEALVLALGTGIAARSALPHLVRPPRQARRVAVACARISLGGSLASLAQVVATSASTAVLGAGATGLYDRARRVVGGFDDLLMKAISPVVLPALSDKLRRGETSRDPYLFKLAAISAIAWPFFGSLALLAEPVVLVLLGRDWGEAVPVVRAFCLLGVAAPFHLVDGQFFVSAGREREYLRVQLRSQLAGVGLILVAVPFGIVWVAAAVVAGKAIKAAATTTSLARELGLGPGHLLGAVRASLVAAASTCAAVASVSALAPSGLVDAPWTLLFVAGLAAAFAFALPTALLGHPLWIEARAAAQRSP